MMWVWKNYLEGVALFSELTFSSFSQLVFGLLLSSYDICQLMHECIFIIKQTKQMFSHTDWHLNILCQWLSYSSHASSSPCSVLREREEGKTDRASLRAGWGWDGMWVHEEALGRWVGAAFCRSRFHLWVLIWEGPGHSRCVCECVWSLAMMRAVRGAGEQWEITLTGSALYIIQGSDAVHECWSECAESLIIWCVDAVAVCGLNLTGAVLLNLRENIFWLEKNFGVSCSYQLVELRIIATL